jgi:hypothetical protein
VEARLLEGDSLAGEKHLHPVGQRLPGLQHRRLARAAGHDNVEHLLDLSPGKGVQQPQVPFARLRCLLTSRGSPPVFVSVISATTYSPIYTSSGSLSSSCIIGVDQAFGIGQLGKARGESAMTPAERFPARAHLRIGCVHQGVWSWSEKPNVALPG